MKKKLMFLLFLLVGLFVFGDRVYAVSEPSTYLQSYCNSICAEQTYYNANQGCKDACLSHTEIDDACKTTAEKGASNAGFKCYVTRLCSSFSNYQYCIDHEQGNKVISAAEQAVIDASDKAIATEAVCKALCHDLKEVDNTSASYYGYNGCYENCTNTCASINCKTQTCFKNRLCEQTFFSTTRFCNTSLTASQFNNNSSSADSYVTYTIDESGDNISHDDTEYDKNYMKRITESNCYGFGDVIYYVTLIVKIFQIVAPIILIVWASVDLFKSVIAGDEKKIVEMRKPILRRFIAAIFVFLVPWIVNSIVNGFNGSNTWLTCWKKYGYKMSADSGSSTATSAIKQACDYACAGQNIDNCKEKCINAYETSGTNCQNAVPSSGSTSSTDKNNAIAKCYSNFAANWVNSNK